MKEDPPAPCVACGQVHGPTNALINCLTRHLKRTRERLEAAEATVRRQKKEIEFMRDNTVRLYPGSTRRVEPK